MVRLGSAEKKQIEQQALETYPLECCGILVGTDDEAGRTISHLVPEENLRTDSLANRYLIDPQSIYRVESKLRGSGRSIVGFYHSHPDAPARPSEYDREHAWPWYLYLIVSVRQGRVEEMTCWRLSDDHSRFENEPLQE